jgi:hypothetical protein
MRKCKAIYIFLSAIIWIGISGTAHSQVLINEVCPANGDINYDPDFFNFSPWLELYNAGSSSVNISGYYLSDDLSDKARWAFPPGSVIPAKGYLLVWCDEMSAGLHTNFKLDSDGEDLILSNSNQVVVDEIKYPKQYVNVSYGRTVSGGTSWNYLLSPTPGAVNISVSGSMQLESPVFNRIPGRYEGVQAISIMHPQQGVEIRYTLDGTEPTKNSSLYNAPITINKTTTIKAQAYAINYIPSLTEVGTYFINEHVFTLPVVSISTKPTYLNDNVIGIYVDGSNGKTGNCKQTPVNWNQDWYRHATIELFDNTGRRQFDQAVDIRIGGGCSRNNPQKSLVIKARDKYGNNTIDEKLFDTKDHDRYGGIILRNSGNDFNTTMFRDALMQSLTIGQMDVDYLAYQPAAFYLNGQYWGIQNLREKIDADYIETNYGIKSNDIDLIESWGFAIEGSANAYNTYLNTLQTLNPLSPSTFEFIDQHIDVQEYINYLAAEIYYGNTDWPGNNIKFWRQRSNNGKFRWILWDLDFGFALYSWASNATHPTLSFATDPNSGVGWPNPPWSTLHIRLLLQNPEFRNRFIQTLTTSISTTFHPQRVNKFINEFQSRISTEMPFHKQRWGGNSNDWNFEVQRLRDFSVSRNQFMKQHVSSFFGLSEMVKIHASASPIATGSVRLNGILLDEPLSDGDYYKGIPYQAEAVASPGYQFKNWLIKKRDVTTTSFINQGDEWKYLDAGILPGANWTSINFADNLWSSGAAQLGYGDGDEKTIVDYGPDVNNKFITTYFRKAFTVADPSTIDNIKASVLFDDGVVVYINGIEVFRNNMPVGTITNTTLALQAIPVENEFISFTIPVNLLVDGNNVISVEVHQNSPQSSDVSFDFSLQGIRLGNELQFTSADPIVTGIADSEIYLEAVFEEVLPVSNLIINEVSAAPSSYLDELGHADDWIEIFNNSDKTIDLANLFVTDNTRRKLKHQIKSGSSATRIAPGEYKILWADNQTGQGPLHVNFRLSAEGEEVGLYQMVGANLLTLDEMNFANQFKGVTSSRIPNATGAFTLTSSPTPGTENIFELITGAEEQSIPEVHVYPNPTRSVVHIKSEYPLDDISLCNHQGVLLYRQQSQSNQTEVSLNDFPVGLYLLKIRSGEKQILQRIIRN